MTIKGIATTVATLLLFVAQTNGAAQATVFSLDEFFIEKGATTASRTEIFRDSFDDGILPPSGPDGAATYNVRGAGFFAENTGGNGRLSIDSSLATPGFSGTALFGRIRRLSSTTPGDPDTLDATSSWATHGVFDLGVLPQNNERVGLRLEDFGSTSNGNDRLQLRIVRDAGGTLSVMFSGSDFNNVSEEIFDQIDLQPLLTTHASADQILLSLQNDDSSSEVTAEFTLLASNSIVFSQVLDNIGDTTSLAAAVFSDEGFTRAAIVSSEDIAVSEPGALAVFGFSLAAIGAIRRRRKQT